LEAFEFVATKIRLCEEEVFQPVNLRVRLCEFENEGIVEFARNLYDLYGDTTFAQRFHISANGSSDDAIIFGSNSVTGCRMYLRQVGVGDVWTSPIASQE
jgi:hypothetical protein